MCIYIYISGWWFGCHLDYFPTNIALLIIPIDFHSIIFQRGGPTTNQIYISTYDITASCFLEPLGCGFSASHVEQKILKRCQNHGVKRCSEITCKTWGKKTLEHMEVS